MRHNGRLVGVVLGYFFFLMIRRPPRSTQSRSSAASDVYKRQHPKCMAGDPGTDKEWLNLAFDSHDRIPFHGIVLSQPLIDGCGRECDALVEFFSSLDSARWNGRRKRTLSLSKSDADYRTALTAILRHAKSLALIDPWLNSQDSRYFDTVTICSNVLGQRGHARLQGLSLIHI